jgi:hypothetical protein
MRSWLPVPVLLVCACSPTAQPLPTIASVEPASMPEDSRFSLTVQLEGLFPLEVDYGGGTAEVNGAERVIVAGKDCEITGTGDDGQLLTVDVIPWLPMGPQDVQIELKDGRQVVLEKGFVVTPKLQLTGFEISPIGNQIRRQPFTVRIQALGPDAGRFQGQVIIRSTQGDVNPKLSDAFTAGVLEQSLTGDVSTDSSVGLIVEDYAGHTGLSNDFLLAVP